MIRIGDKNAYRLFHRQSLPKVTLTLWHGSLITSMLDCAKHGKYLIIHAVADKTVWQNYR